MMYLCNPSIVEKYKYVELEAKKVVMNCKLAVPPLLTKQTLLSLSISV